MIKLNRKQEELVEMTLVALTIDFGCCAYYGFITLSGLQMFMVAFTIAIPIVLWSIYLAYKARDKK